mmetsp:Transcript_5910/g.7221  ORF Transcript_5910/g.7221 Transcript_5910/m.7221 type:complete len:213 (-) Transcript_5910:2206-2844(-)
MAPKRLFYEDDEVIITKPGFNEEISEDLKQQESSHGNISFVKGMGIRTAPVLEEYVNKARLVLHEKLSYYGAELGTQQSALCNEYKTIKNEVQSSIKEPVLPNLIYVLTSSLTGSILVNRRSLPLRFITPVIFGGVAFNYFMPRSYNVVQEKVTNYEKENLPNVYKNQITLAENYQDFRKNLFQGLDNTASQIENSVHEARLYLIDLFSEKK